MSFSAAKSRVTQAQMLIEVRRYDEVPAVLDAAVGFLLGLPEEETVEISAQIAALRVAAAEAEAAERYGAKIRTAERELRTAKEDIERGYAASAVEYRFDRVVEYLESVPEALKAPLLEENEKLRSMLAARHGGSPAPAAASPEPAAPVLSHEQSANLSAARSRLTHARMNMDSRRYDEVPAVLDAAVGFLRGLPEEETAEIAAQIAELRAAAAEADAAERYGAKIRSAERELRIAKEDIEKGNVMPSGIDYRFDKVVEYLEGVPEALKAPLLDQNEVLRSILAAREGGSAAPAAGSGPATPALSPDDEVNLSRARNRIVAARSLVESRRTEGVEGVLDEAAGFLVNIAEDDRAPLLAEIDALRADIETVNQAEFTRKIESEFSRHLYEAENVNTWKPEDSARALNHLTARLAEEDLRKGLPAETLEQYESRVAAATVNRAAVLKAYALERAMPLLEEFEGRVVTDPFEGLDQAAAYRVTGELDHLRYRTLHELKDLPEDDTDVVAINARVGAVNEKIEEASAAWALAALHESVRESWAILERDEEIAGWREETADPEPRLLEVPSLPKTRTAIIRIGYLLADPKTGQIREENPGDEVVESTYRRAEEEREAAVATMAAAYNFVLAEAEKVQTPTRSDDLTQTMHFSTAAKNTFEGTSALDAILERTQALDERWKAEVAAIAQARQGLYDKLAAEADAVWPEIVKATGATDDFDPGDTTAAGKTVHLEAVYNRAGWDFKNFDFCVRWGGIPVGGTYEPHVAQALEHAWYTLKLDVNDRITWDVIGVIQGPGKIGERTQVQIKGSNGLEIGKVEEWKPVECVRLKIIGLHAGAVAVGPDHPWQPTG